MKKVGLFLLATLLFYGAAFFTDLYSQAQARPDRSTVQFQFRLPLPREVMLQQNAPEPVRVERVFAAGTFNNWQDGDPLYELKAQPDGSWFLETTLPYGESQYKFVLNLAGRLNPVWTHDNGRSARVEDGYGGYNSLISHTDGRSWLSPLFFIFLGGGSLALLLGLMEALSLLVFRYGLSHRSRNVTIISLAALTALGFSLVMNLESQKTLVRRSLTDMLNQQHLRLVSAGFDPARLTEETQAQLFTEEQRRWFAEADARILGDSFNNNQTVLRTLFLLDKDFNLKAFVERSQENARTIFWTQKTQSRTRLRYFQEVVLGPLLATARQHGVAASGLFSLESEVSLQALPGGSRLAAAFLGFNTVLIPLRQGPEVVGYSAALFHPDIFSEGLMQMIWTNLGWLGAVSLALFAYFFLFPRNNDEQKLRLQRFSSRFQLSAREQEVLAHLATGLSNQDIADKLFISEGTVKVHVHKIFQKSGLGSRIELLDRLSNL